MHTEGIPCQTGSVFQSQEANFEMEETTDNIFQY